MLGEIGELLEEAKATAPKRPRPKASDEPPANVLAGLVAGVVDRGRAAGKGAAQHVKKKTRSVRS